MGWCSGTDVFDAVSLFVIESNWADQTIIEFFKRLIDALEDLDWDCQNEVNQWDHPLVRRAFVVLHPDWFEDESAVTP